MYKKVLAGWDRTVSSSGLVGLVPNSNSPAVFRYRGSCPPGRVFTNSSASVNAGPIALTQRLVKPMLFSDSGGEPLTTGQTSYSLRHSWQSLRPEAMSLVAVAMTLRSLVLL